MMPCLHVFELEANRVAMIMPLMEQAFDSNYSEAWKPAQVMDTLRLPGTRLMVCKCDDVAVGFILFQTLYESCEILLLGVLPDYRHRGIGRSLLQHCIRQAPNQNTKKVFLEVRENNPARSFYAENGFVEIGRRKNYYSSEHGNQVDALTMQLSISCDA